MDGYKTVYETGDFEFHIIISYIISILMIAAFTYVVVHNIKYKMTFSDETESKKVITERVFAIFALSVTVSVFFSILITNIIEYRDIKKIYNSGETLIVEGEVSDFIPMKLEGHSSESFTVNGIEFTYSRSVPANGYHLAKVDGGYIHGNGQKVRIHYIYCNNIAIILKLEIKEWLNIKLLNIPIRRYYYFINY